MRRIRRVHVLVAALAAALCVPASGVSSAAGRADDDHEGREERGRAQPDRLGGLHTTAWVKPFTKATGCKVQAEVRRLLGRDGDADARPAQYDAVSASGDASLRLIVGKDVRARSIRS